MVGGKGRGWVGGRRVGQAVCVCVGLRTCTRVVVEGKAGVLIRRFGFFTRDIVQDLRYYDLHAFHVGIGATLGVSWVTSFHRTSKNWRYANMEAGNLQSLPNGSGGADYGRSPSVPAQVV